MKKYKYTLLTIIILVILINLVIDPKNISPFSYNNLKGKLKIIESKEDYCIQTQQNIIHAKNELGEKKAKTEMLEKTYSQLIEKKYLYNGFHFPSVLIILEQQAVEKHLSFHIYHELMIDSSVLKSFETKKTNEISGKTSDNENPEEEKEKNEFTLKDKIREAIQISGPPNLKVTALPISVRGSYSDIRDYIAFLDRLNYIEPYAVKISSETGLRAEIVLQIFWIQT